MDRANDLVLLLGRLLMAALFLPSGISKLLGFSGFAASLATKGLPYGGMGSSCCRDRSSRSYRAHPRIFFPAQPRCF